MKTILNYTMLITFALGSAASAFAANDAVEDAWRNNTRAQNTPFEWALAKRLAKGSDQVASSGAMQTDVSNQKEMRKHSFQDNPWADFH